MGSRFKAWYALSVPVVGLLWGCGSAPSKPVIDPVQYGSLLVAEHYALMPQPSAYCQLTSAGSCESQSATRPPHASRAGLSLLASDSSVPTSGFLKTGPLQGYALNGDLFANSGYGSIGLLLASDAETASSLTAGLGWANESGRGDQLRMNLLRQQSGDHNANGQWLASVQSALQPATPLGNAQLEGEVALLRSDSGDTQSGAPLGARMRLSGPDKGPLNYAVTLSRYDSGFTVAGASAGQQLVAADLQYRLLKDLRLITRTEYRERGFDEGPLRRDRRSSLTMTGPLLKPWLASYSPTAELHFAQASHVAPQTRLDQTVNHLDIKLTQPLPNGWRYRLQMSLQDGEDRYGTRDFDRRQFQVTGDHTLQLGSFAGSVGPALSLDSRSGFNERTIYKAGLEMRLKNAIQQLSLEMGYEMTDTPNTLHSDRDISFGLKYRLDV